MTQEEIDILLRPEVQETLVRHLHDDPSQVALHLGDHRALIATQLKYLQRARTKLPSFYAAGCVFPPLAFEQSSSEAAAAEKRYQGTRCLDLTCGLGVDSLALARQFREVVAIERDPVIAYAARCNFARMGISNISVRNASAEQVLAEWSDPVDLIYLDPARRGDGNRKLFRLEECSPNLLALAPRLLELSPRVVAKLSPLFDVDEAFRLFGSGITVEVLSVGVECKEVLIELTRATFQTPLSPQDTGILRVTRAGMGSLCFQSGASTPLVLPEYTPPYEFLLIPDVSLYKARRVAHYAAQLGVYPLSEMGYCLSHTLPASFFGRCYAIRACCPYQPKVLRRRLEAEGIRRATLLKRDFPYSAEEIAHALHITQGGEQFLAFTRIEGKGVVLFLDSIEA